MCHWCLFYLFTYLMSGGEMIERICKRDEKCILMTAMRFREMVGGDDEREATASILR